MLDIKLFREQPDLIRESEKKRFKDPSIVDKVIEYDSKWRESLKKLEQLRKERNLKAKEIAELAKSKQKPPASLIEENKALKEQIAELESKVQEFLKLRDEALRKVGNILHPAVPIAETEEGAAVLRMEGKPREFSFEPKPHADLVELLGVVDVERAAKVAGARFYYLIGDLVLMNLALIQYAMNTLVQEGYTPIQPPYFLNSKHMSGAAELADFEETLYKIDGRDLFLIATSEQSIVAMHSDEVIPDEALPQRFAGFSTCFRREAHRENAFARGIFRVHQFEKVEQLVFTRPEDSWDEHERMVRISEKIFAGLGLPYRVIDIASGDLNDAAARKFDVEVWFPTQNKYRELASISNTTDFQARRLNMKVGRYGGEKTYLHTLNGTALATERTMCAILENFQLEDGSVEIPKVLRPLMGGKEVLRPSSLPLGH